MNLQRMYQLISRISEISVIGKNARIEGIDCNIMGLARYDKQVRLLILQYDETYEQRLAMYDEEACKIPHIQMTNRQHMQRSHQNDMKSPFQSVRTICINDEEFSVTSTETSMNHSQGLESTMMLMEFLHQGWQPDGIDLPDLDLLFLTSIELKGEYDLLPVIPVDAALTFKMHPNSIAHAVEQTFTLTMGTEYPEKLYFKDMATKEEHWMQINSVYLLDMWEDMNRKFDDPKFKEHMTPEQIARTRKSLEEHLPDICPKGMCIPVIEYECEEGISLQFYTKAHLDAVPEHKNSASSIGFIGSPDKETGVLGMKLKAAFLPEAVSAKTDKIEVELFQYNCLSKTREFTI